MGCCPFRSPEKRYRAVVRHRSEDNGEGGRGCIAAPRSFVTRTGPEPCGLGLSGAVRQHLHRCVVGKDRLGRQNMSPLSAMHASPREAMDGIGQRFQQDLGFADPVGQRRAVEIQPVAVEDLAVKRQVINKLADQNVRQQARPRAATLDRARRQRGLHEPFTARTGQPRANNPVHDEASRNVFQFLGHIFADPAQTPAAIGTGIGARGQFDFHPGGWSVIGRRLGLSFSSMSGRRIRAIIVAVAISLVSSANCSCSAVSDDAPNRCAWCPASWCRSFSIRIACAFTSARSRAAPRGLWARSGSDLACNQFISLYSFWESLIAG